MVIWQVLTYFSTFICLTFIVNVPLVLSLPLLILLHIPAPLPRPRMIFRSVCRSVYLFFFSQSTLKTNSSIHHFYHVTLVQVNWYTYDGIYKYWYVLISTVLSVMKVRYILIVCRKIEKQSLAAHRIIWTSSVANYPFIICRLSLTKLAGPPQFVCPVVCEISPTGSNMTIKG